MEYIITVKDLSLKLRKRAGRFPLALIRRQFEEQIALNEVNFAVAPGLLLGIVGQDNSGKTNLIEILAGYQNPTSGEVSILGNKPDQKDRGFQANVKLISQNHKQLWPQLSVREVLPIIREKFQIPQAELNEDVTQIAELLGISDLLKTQSRKLSAYNQFRCELLLALLTKPQVIFLDNIFNNFDEASLLKAKELITWVHKHWQLTSIVTTGVIQDLNNICDAVAVLDAGSIIYSGSIEELINNHANYLYIDLMLEKPVIESEIAAITHVVKMNGLKATVVTPRESKGQISSMLIQKLPIKDMLFREPLLEEIVEQIKSQPTTPAVPETQTADEIQPEVAA